MPAVQANLPALHLRNFIVPPSMCFAELANPTQAGTPSGSIFQCMAARARDWRHRHPKRRRLYTRFWIAPVFLEKVSMQKRTLNMWDKTAKMGASGAAGDRNSISSFSKV